MRQDRILFPGFTRPPSATWYLHQVPHKYEELHETIPHPTVPLSATQSYTEAYINIESYMKLPESVYHYRELHDPYPKTREMVTLMSGVIMLIDIPV